jgi:RNA polymerase sigma-70 factor (ECF subfamily)
MSEPTDNPDNIDRIATRWSAIHDVEHFVVRYAGAVRHYLEALLGAGPDADDVFQEFFLRVVEHGFVRACPDRGRFRDYLKTAVRNAALTHLRRRQRQPDAVDVTVLQDSVPGADEAGADRAWLDDWRACLLRRAWRALEAHQQRSPGNLFWTALRLTADHPDEDSAALAARAGASAGRPLRADAFRKQLSGARRLFARLLVEEVAQTLECASAADVEEELAQTGLSQHVLPYLPDDWRDSFTA